jgi:hypothetical protein
MDNIISSIEWIPETIGKHVFSTMRLPGVVLRVSQSGALGEEWWFWGMVRLSDNDMMKCDDEPTEQEAKAAAIAAYRSTLE